MTQTRNKTSIKNKANIGKKAFNASKAGIESKANNESKANIESKAGIESNLIRRLEALPKPRKKTDVIMVCAFYKFVQWADYRKDKPKLETLCRKAGIEGTILLAQEGINGTIAGKPSQIKEFLHNVLWSDEKFFDIVPKISWTKTMPFLRLRVRLKKEIVTLGQKNANPQKQVGTYIAPNKWNDFISQADTLTIDTRNVYECEIGSFKGAISPATNHFREFASWVQTKLKPLMKQTNKTKLALFCTGGIRCEKATSYLLAEGFDNVFHLKGGILQYLEEARDKTYWQGECFVFDNRVAVNRALKQSDWDMCHGCRAPLAPQDKKSPHYEMGSFCPKCYGTHSDEKLARTRARQKQILLARKRGVKHLGQQIK